jgi:hypothetical protein
MRLASPCCTRMMARHGRQLCSEVIRATHDFRPGTAHRCSVLSNRGRREHEYLCAGRHVTRKLGSGLQKWAVNPIVPLEHDLGIPSPGDAVPETTGRTGLPQRSPKGKSRGIE